MSLKRTILPRIIVYPQDVQNITRRGKRSSQQLLKNIRTAFGKEKFQYVTVDEFCAFTGLDPEQVQDYLKDWDDSKIVWARHFGGFFIAQVSTEDQPMNNRRTTEQLQSQILNRKPAFQSKFQERQLWNNRSLRKKRKEKQLKTWMRKIRHNAHKALTESKLAWYWI
jgi:hypothetical protein